MSTPPDPPAGLPEYYTPRYCEENVWRLCQDGRVGPGERYVVFVSSLERAVPMAMQRAGEGAGGVLVWDYHVVLLARAAGWWIWDFDTQLGCPVAAARWLRDSFPLRGAWPAEFEPRFRLVAADEFVRTFASDRSHMRAPDGALSAPPPPHPPIRTAAETMNLPRFVDMARPFVGEVLTWDALLARVAG